MASFFKKEQAARLVALAEEQGLEWNWGGLGGILTPAGCGGKSRHSGDITELYTARETGGGAGVEDEAGRDNWGVQGI